MVFARVGRIKMVQFEPSINVTRSATMNNRVLPIHPGRVLLEEFLAPRGLSVWHLAKDIGVSVQRLYQIIQGQRPITADIAHRLAHYFGMSERYWLDLQIRYDFSVGNGDGDVCRKRIGRCCLAVAK